PRQQRRNRTGRRPRNLLPITPEPERYLNDLHPAAQARPPTQRVLPSGVLAIPRTTKERRRDAIPNRHFEPLRGTQWPPGNCHAQSHNGLAKPPARAESSPSSPP